MLVSEENYDVPFKFNTIPMIEIALEEGGNNDIGAIFRRYDKTARAIKYIWKDFKPNKAFDKIFEESPSKKIRINEITYYNHETKKWDYRIILDLKESPVFSVIRSYTTNPWIISRWIKLSGQVFGTGPILNALPDAKTANEAKRLELKNASLAISGLWLGRNNGILNPSAIKMIPGSIIPVMSTGGQMGADLTRLEVGGDFQYSQIIQKELQQSIKDSMFDRSIPDIGPVRSATEWIVRQQELHQAIGAPFGRLYQEFVRPLFKRMLDILYRQGHISEDFVSDEGLFDVQLTGSLGQVQAMKDLEAIDNWGKLNTALVGPEVFMATAKVENIVSKTGNLLGVPPELIRSEKEKRELMAAAMASQQKRQA
jgi:hypothetical protein